MEKLPPNLFIQPFASRDEQKAATIAEPYSFTQQFINDGKPERYRQATHFPCRSMELRKNDIPPQCILPYFPKMGYNAPCRKRR